MLSQKKSATECILCAPSVEERKMYVYLFIFIKRNTGKITLKLISTNGIETSIFYNFDFDHIFYVSKT